MGISATTTKMKRLYMTKTTSIREMRAGTAPVGTPTSAHLGKIGGSSPCVPLFSASSSDATADPKFCAHLQPGTYTWPILIPVSSQLPPSIFCTWGQTQYRLKAKVRRPGALTANLTAETEVQLVNTPGDDDTEESESIVVDRMWDTQLHYNIAILQKVRALC